MIAGLVFLLFISLAITAIIWLVALAFGVTLNFFITYIVVVIVVYILIRILG